MHMLLSDYDVTGIRVLAVSRDHKQYVIKPFTHNDWIKCQMVPVINNKSMHDSL